jgi:hypothetical protein
LSRIVRPIEPGLRDAPITAIEAGANSARRLRPAAIRSRSAAAARNRSLSAIGISTW